MSKTSSAGAAAVDKKIEPKKSKEKHNVKYSHEANKKDGSVASAFKKPDAPIKRTLSVQNVGGSAPLSLMPSSTNLSKLSVKRAHSSQNVSAQKAGARQIRLSAPVNAMAYNAELLANFEKEKKIMERRISELIQIAENRQRDNEKFKFEVKNLKEKLKDARMLLKDHQSHYSSSQQQQQQTQQQQNLPSPESSLLLIEEINQLKKENNIYRQKLSELNICLDDQLTETERSSVVQAAQKKVKSDADEFSNKNKSSPSDSDSQKETEAFDMTSSMCVEKRSNYSLDCNCWDHQSNKSSDGALSEVSVACLQDRILQMEETHYSTNEELQATLQELADLQDAVNDLTVENERLANERNVLLESLCTQTEKLENARLHVDFVKALLLRDSELLGGERSENERQLMALVKSAQEEREELLLRQVEMSNNLQMLQRENHEIQEANDVVQMRLTSSQKEVEDVKVEKVNLELQNSSLEEQLDHGKLELEKLRIVLESEQKKVTEMEHERRLLQEKSEMTTVVQLLRDEKEKLETKLVSLEQELSERRFEGAKLQETCDLLQEELKLNTSKANAKLVEKNSELESQLQRARNHCSEMEEEISLLQHDVETLKVECDQHIDDKKTHTLTLARAESELRIWRSKASRAEKDFKELQEKFIREQDEWNQFQQDLQRAVVIANEFKTEAQEDAERVANDYQRMQDQVRLLGKELELSKTETDHLKKQLLSANQQLQQQQQQLQQQQQQQQQQQPQQTVSTTNVAPQRSSSCSSCGLALDPTTTPMSREEIRDKVLSSMDRELANRRQISRKSDFRQQHQQLSVRHLISSIEEQVKNKDNVTTIATTTNNNQGQISPACIMSPMPNLACGASGSGASAMRKDSLTSPTFLSGSGGGNGSGVKIGGLSSRLGSVNASQNYLRRSSTETKDATSPTHHHHHHHHHHLQSLTLDILQAPTATDDTKQAVVECTKDIEASTSTSSSSSSALVASRKPLVGILSNKVVGQKRKSSVNSDNIETSPEKTSHTPSGHHLSKVDPLSNLAKQLGGSKRNALLKWCQNRTATYRDIDITNFSSSWNDGMAFCALLHTYMPDKIPYKELNTSDKVRNFTLAFKGAESVGITPALNIMEMATRERPDWQAVMSYVTNIYKHFESTN
ncbi:hypothetical protein HELRODRAFT_188743 [Helobdella robusta]|uniref:Calponin-homology (CH) domain-containing protein n=1 Tax=Helobdella robusta TaxID=6412 RepID=T1FQB6_HELRO|nr:hypothetical protein HELRODRAFT_188743 [Helobdella robusta]ESO02534.1 hypothetical protein HELRODRAFT_188743 [Helobdella robusta]